jgi:hypothetical protein
MSLGQGKFYYVVGLEKSAAGRSRYVAFAVRNQHPLEWFREKKDRVLLFYKELTLEEFEFMMVTERQEEKRR